MKPALLASCLLAGFALGWLLKPAPSQPETSGITAKPTPTPPTELPPTTAAEPPAPPPVPFPQRQHNLPSNFSDIAIANAARRDEAKLARLVEALALSPDQAAALQSTLKAAREPAEPTNENPYPGPAEVVAGLRSSAGVLEASVLALLTPDQQSAFADLRERIRENRQTSKTEREIAQLQDMVDLTPDQRDQLRQRLRESSESTTDSTNIDLILDSSPLPLGPSAVTDQGYETLLQLAGIPPSREPAATHLQLVEQQRKDLDQRLERFKDILTPAQFERYRVEIAEQRSILDLMAPPSP